MDCESIPSSSSSKSKQVWTYDVFLSFRGDTRNNFTDHLYAALYRKGIAIFKDDQKLKKGETIASELLEAIKESRVSVVVFSKKYAGSRWCLEELAHIVECMELEEQTVLPVFYDVDPSDVRKQSGVYKDAFADHEITFKEKLHQVQRWRKAMEKVGNLCGWDVRDKPEAVEVENIVKEVISRLGHRLSNDDLVGMDSRVEELEKLLDFDSDDDDVRVIGICGMGGIGKTTLASVVYDRNSHKFDACSFLDDISNFSGGLISVQEKLLCDALKDEKLKIRTPRQGTNLIRTRLRHLKAFIVLDNVDQSEQLEKLARKSDIGARSRIIITTRDQHILREHGVDIVYNVELLNKEESLDLFCRKAFKCYDVMRGYEELTHLLLEYAQSLPLAIEVLGSFLFGRDVVEWRSAWDRLRENPKKKIMDVLQTSYEGLENIDKEIFLDIACLFKGMHHYYVRKILDCCGLSPDIGITVLIEKSLITILRQKIRMHDMLQELGRKIVREGKSSRLWLYKDFQEEREVEDVEAMVLNPGFPDEYQLDFPSQDLKDEEDEKFLLRAETLSKMSHLKLLILYNVNFSGSLNCLSNELQYLFWHKYPFTSLPSSFQPARLIELNMPGNRIEQPWKGIKCMPNLKRINLCHSKNLMKIPDFSGLPNLERLDLGGCTKLQQIHPSLGLLKKLWLLDLANCKSLVSLPNSIWGLSCLKVLYLTGCSKLVLNNQLLAKASNAENLKTLEIIETDMPSTSSILTIPMLPFLHYLNLSFCGLREIPDAIGQLSCLERLDLGVNNFVRLPSSIKNLSKLKYLNLEHCRELQSLPELPSTTALPVRRDFSEVRTDKARPLGYSAGLYIFNCPKLARIESCTSMAFSWILRVLQEPHAEGDWIDIFIPGSQIPSWFQHPTSESAISLQQSPPPNVDDNNWIGVAFCAVFSVQNHPTILNDEQDPSLWCPCSVGSSVRDCWMDIMRILMHNSVDDNNIEGTMNTLRKGSRPCFSIRKKKGGGYNFSIPILIERETVESNHLWLIYITREHELIAKIIHSIDHIRFTARLGMEVKNCGLHWVFKQDLEDLYTLIHNGKQHVNS